MKTPTAERAPAPRDVRRAGLGASQQLGLLILLALLAALAVYRAW